MGGGGAGHNPFDIFEQFFGGGGGFGGGGFGGEHTGIAITTASMKSWKAFG